VTRWSELCDEAIIRCICYLLAYPNVVLTLTSDERDIYKLTSETSEDSDHASDKETSSSISGAASFVMGQNGTKAQLAWFAVKMRAAGVSTGEVEVAAAAGSNERSKKKRD
jgi:hypothetical protein